MKKSLLGSLFLLIIDQSFKLFIAQYYANISAVLLPGILRFCPVQNTNFTWIASIIDYDTPVFLMLLFQILGIAFILLAHRYLSYLWNEKKHLLNVMLVCYIAGIVCSFIDVVFWGGSLDYIRLFDWFTFDMKDVYLTIGTIHVFLYGGIYIFRVYRKMSKEERKQTTGLWHWMKSGLPSQK